MKCGHTAALNLRLCSSWLACLNAYFVRHRAAWRSDSISVSVHGTFVCTRSYLGHNDFVLIPLRVCNAQSAGSLFGPSFILAKPRKKKRFCYRFWKSREFVVPNVRQRVLPIFCSRKTSNYVKKIRCFRT